MSNGSLQRGQTFDEQTGLTKGFSEQMLDRVSADAIDGQALTEIIPHDAASALSRVHDDISADLIAIAPRMTAGSINMSKGQLPDTLDSISVVYNSSEQVGNHVQDPAIVKSVGTSVSVSVTSSASSQSGAATMPDIAWKIHETPGDSLPCTHAFFYMTGNVTRAGVLARLTAGDAFAATVLSWPLFKPKSDTFVMLGQNVSVRAEASSAVEVSGSATAGSISLLPGNDPTNFFLGGVITGERSDGVSKDVGITSRVVTLPPTIHSAKTLSSSGQTKYAEAQVKANIDSLIRDGSPVTPDVINEPTPTLVAAISEISPTGIDATSPASIPVTGLYLVELFTEPYNANNFLIHAVVIDATIFV